MPASPPVTAASKRIETAQIQEAVRSEPLVEKIPSIVRIEQNPILVITGYGKNGEYDERYLIQNKAAPSKLENDPHTNIREGSFYFNHARGLCRISYGPINCFKKGKAEKHEKPAEKFNAPAYHLSFETVVRKEGGAYPASAVLVLNDDGYRAICRIVECAQKDGGIIIPEKMDHHQQVGALLNLLRDIGPELTLEVIGQFEKFGSSTVNIQKENRLVHSTD